MSSTTSALTCIARGHLLEASSFTHGTPPHRWTPDRIDQVLTALTAAWRIHPALLEEAAVTPDDLRTPTDARYLVRRFLRLV